MVSSLRAYAESPGSIMDAAIQLWRSTFQATIVVEGTNDIKFFKNYLNPKVVRVVAADGKSGVLEVFRRCKKKNFDAARFVVDIDNDTCTNKPLSRDPSLAYIATNPSGNDGHYANDLECLLIRSGALERVCSEYQSPLDPLALQERLILVGTRISSFRLAAWDHLSSDGRTEMLSSASRFVEPKTLSPDETAFSRILKTFSKTVQEAVERSVADATSGANYRPWLYCRGHDLTDILAAHFGKYVSFRLVRDEIERSLRLAAQWHQVAETPLGKQLVAWKTPAVGPVSRKAFLKPEYLSL